MDGRAFSNLNLTALFCWPLLVLAAIGCVSILAGIGLGLGWLLSHLQWV